MEKIIVYLVYIIIASFFAFLAQKFDKKEKEHKITGKRAIIFYIMSCITLIVLMGFRKSGVGVDDVWYKDIFLKISKNGCISEFLATKMEIGYLLLNQIVCLFTQDFQVVIVITTIIPMILYYKAIEYEKNNISLPISIFLFGSLMCVYYFGIIRLFIAASIVAYSLRYIFENKPLKYIICILIAMTFHYSAGIMLIFIILAMKSGKHSKSAKLNKRLLIVMIIVLIVIPICMFVLSEVIFPLMGSRYSRYRLKYEGIGLNDFDKLPFFIMFILFYKIFNSKEKDTNTPMYILFYLMLTIISVYSSFMDIGRLQWYFNFAACILFSRVYRTIKESKYKKLIIAYVPALFIYGILYMNTIINSPSRIRVMSKYINILFK